MKSTKGMQIECVNNVDFGAERNQPLFCPGVYSVRKLCALCGYKEYITIVSVCFQNAMFYKQQF